ncbi:MAG: adenylate kinase [Acidimicrobiales bacterium]
MVPGVRLVLLGKQGAGKGTQCVRLSRHYVVPHISTGDMLRSATKSATDFGREVADYLRMGELVPDDVMIKVVEHRLEQHDTKERGFLLDGFPRTVGQAEALEALLAPRGLDLVLDLEVPTDIVLERLASRRVCSVCGTIFGIDNPARRGKICDNCGGELSQRDDDTEDSIRRRLELYASQTEPLITWYLERHKLAAVDGLGAPERITARLVRAIDNRRQRPPSMRG